MRESLHFPAQPPESLPQEVREQLLLDVQRELTLPDDQAWQVRNLETFTQEIITHGSPREASAAAEIILADTLHGNPIPEILGSFSAYNEYEKKQQLLGVAIAEPELAHAIVANSVGGFHASNSASLLGVLEHGLLSSKDARDRGLALGSGERTYTRPNARPFISFADWRDPDTLWQYSHTGQPTDLTHYHDIQAQLALSVDAITQQWGDNHLFAQNGRLQIEDTRRIINILETEPTSERSALITANFPVLYGFDISDYTHAPTNLGLENFGEQKLLVERLAHTSVRSEFAVVNGSVPPEDIPIIAVPSHYVDSVRTLVHQTGHGIDVYPFDTLVSRHTAR